MNVVFVFKKYNQICPTRLNVSSVLSVSLTEYPDKKEVCKDAMIHLIQLCQPTTAEQERKHFTL